MRCKWSKWAPVAVLLLLSMLTLSGTAAAFFADSNSRNNTAVVGENEASIVETFMTPEEISAGERVTKSVEVKNTGMKSYVRMFVAVSDSEYAESFKMNISPDWKKAQDGYYYYKRAVDRDEMTNPIFDTLTFTKALPNNSGLEIICYAETVQAQGFKSAEEAFKELR